MSTLYLGLEIGDENIRAVLLSRNFRGISVIRDIRTLSLDEENDLDACLELLLTEGSFQEAFCSVSISAREFVFRSLKFPFPDRGKIRQAVLFALEPLIPFPLDQVSFDCQIYPRGDSSTVFSGIAPRHRIEQIFETLARHAVNADALLAGSIPALSALLERCPSPETVALLDFSPFGVTCVVCDKGELVEIRHYALSLNTDDAGDVINNAHLDEQAASLGLELQNTFDLLIWNGRLRREPEMLRLTGSGLGKSAETVRMRLSDRLSIPVEWVDLAGIAGIELDEKVKETWQPALFNQALALAIRPFGGGVNLRFRPPGGRSFFQGKDFNRIAIRFAALSLTILILAGVDFFLNVRLKKTELVQLKEKTARILKETCPDVTRIVDPVAQFKSQIGAAGKGLPHAGLLLDEKSLLTVLREISVLVPPSADLVIKAFSYDGATAVIRGEVKGFAAVEAIKKELGRSHYFENVVVGMSSQVKQSDRVEFEMKLVLVQL